MTVIQIFLWDHTHRVVEYKTRKKPETIIKVVFLSLSFCRTDNNIRESDFNFLRTHGRDAAYAQVSCLPNRTTLPEVGTFF